MMVSKDNDTFFVELKTGNAKDIMRVEAYQLMLNMIREQYFCTPVFYIYRGRKTNGETLYCNAKDIRYETLIIPNVEKNEQIKQIIIDFFQCEHRIKNVGSQFSGDAYVEISDTSNWLPMKELIK